MRTLRDRIRSAQDRRSLARQHDGLELELVRRLPADRDRAMPAC